MRKITGLIILVLLGFMGYKAYDYYHPTDVSTSQDNPKPLVPNSYVKATISKKRVLKGPNRIDEQAIPQKLHKKRTPLT